MSVILSLARVFIYRICAISDSFYFLYQFCEDLFTLKNQNWKKKIFSDLCHFLLPNIIFVLLKLNLKIKCSIGFENLHYSMKCLDYNVIRVGGGVTVFRLKRFIQMMALILLIAFMTLVLYQNVYGFSELEVSWQI